MTGEELARAGEKLYGKRWKAPLARDLEINPSTLWRYTKKNRIPKKVELALASLLRDRF